MSWQEIVQEARDSCPAGHTAYQPVSMDLRCPDCKSRLGHGFTFTKSPLVSDGSVCDMFHDGDQLTCDCGYSGTGAEFTALVDPEA